MRLLTRQEIRFVEQNQGATEALMEKAGLAAAQWVFEHFPPPLAVWVLAGPGNNGMDAKIMSSHLKNAGYEVTLISATGKENSWPEGTPQLLVDGLFGIGLNRSATPPYSDWIIRSWDLGCPIVALDIPSGLDSDGGFAYQPCVRATHTLTFIAAKPGLYTGDGPDHAGKVTVLDLGSPPVSSSGHLLDLSVLEGCWPLRPRNSHKGHFGTLGILGGSSGMEGAAILSGIAALKCGAGRVWLSQENHGRDCPPEIMVTGPDLSGIPHPTTAVAGPGLFPDLSSRDRLSAVLEMACSLVLDAGALTLLANDETLARQVTSRSNFTVMTPHPGEAQRLLGEDVTKKRLDAALRLARRFDCTVVLKGCGSVIAQPDGHWWINPTGNPALSAPGTGDVLAGTIGALLCQMKDPVKAVLLAVYAHGLAAEHCVSMGLGPIGLTATELVDSIRLVLNRRL